LNILGTANLSRFKGDKAATRSMEAWLKICRNAKWKQFLEIRCQFPDADLVGECVVFNIRHNRYRLIAKIFYSTGILLITAALTHAEYDRGGWKHGCGC